MCAGESVALTDVTVANAVGSAVLLLAVTLVFALLASLALSSDSNPSSPKLSSVADTVGLGVLLSVAVVVVGAAVGAST